MLKNLLLLSGFSTFVVIVIIGLDINHRNSISSLPKNTQRRVISINPNFDTKTINNLKKRTPISTNLTEKSNVVSEDSKDAAGTPTPTPTISLLGPQTATGSSIPTVSDQ